MKRILLISTGGTMGMQVMEEGGLDSSQFVQEIFQYAPEIRNIAEIHMVSPFSIDSSDMGIPQWVELGRLVYNNLDDFDGFVILHGTDTMSYTACALSYMLVNVPRPVILTGAQRPLAAIRTDARSNLVEAVELATKPIPEVCVYFNNKLFRGNRTKKISIDEFDAFASPNFPALAAVGLHIERIARHRQVSGLARLEPRFDDRVLALIAFPSLRTSYWEALLDTDVQIVVIEAFGAGNLPTQGTNLVRLVEAFSARDKLVVIGSQSMEGTCDLHLYEGGQQAAALGAISAADMTFEATVVKAMFLLGMLDGNIKRVRRYFHYSIAGEISENEGELLV